jgi:hypothetical protein
VPHLRALLFRRASLHRTNVRALTFKGKNPNGYDLPPQAMALGVPLVRLQGSFEAATVGH